MQINEDHADGVLSTPPSPPFAAAAAAADAASSAAARAAAAALLLAKISILDKSHHSLVKASMVDGSIIITLFSSAMSSAMARFSSALALFSSTAVGALRRQSIGWHVLEEPILNPVPVPLDRKSVV